MAMSNDTNNLDKGFQRIFGEFKHIDEPSEISLCSSCYCMTHTIDGKCGKCGSPSNDQISAEKGIDGVLAAYTKSLSNWISRAESGTLPKNQKDRIIHEIDTEAKTSIGQLLIQARLHEREKMKIWWERHAPVINLGGHETVRNGCYVRVDSLEKANDERVAILIKQLEELSHD